MGKSLLLPRNRLGACILLALSGYIFPAFSVEFNMDILDAEDRNNIDLSHFSEAGYIMPGKYLLTLKINGSTVGDQEISFKEAAFQGDEKSLIRACLSREQVAMLGLRPDALAKIIFNDEGTCANFDGLDGVILKGDLSQSTLDVSVPQAWMEYQDATWLPPSRWENGIPGVMLDYSLNGTVTKTAQGARSQTASGSGTAGVNLGAWRFRGDWQGNYSESGGRSGSATKSFSWGRFYAYRALPSVMAKLTLGEDYLSSDLFDSWRFTGVSLVSDESQLPPKLRGYAPEVSGIARTNAKVTISQQGRIIYETTVAAGPFRIQELNSAVSGELDVQVTEQDGSVQHFQVTTATIPYLTRPGQIRYKFATGRSSNYSHNVEGSLFGTAEASWGISNSWSLYGGGIFSPDYKSLAVGLGRDLFQFGALSADITQSMANLPNEGELQGRSYRISYSKRFDSINSDITFAGYRFAERNYMTMPEYLDSRYHGSTRGNSKELYTVTASKSFTDLRLSTYLSWSHQTYWNKPETDRYSLSLSRYFDVGDWHNISASLSASRSDYNGKKDDALWLSLSMPLGSGTASYNGNYGGKAFSQTAGWYQSLENGDSYRLTAGTRSNRDGSDTTTQASGMYNHNGDHADMTANVSWQEKSYTSASLSVSGGMTATLEGAALHGASNRGGTRMMISADGVADVPIGHDGNTNMFGIAVMPSVPSYYRSSVSVDVNRLPDDVEMGDSPVVEAALTEGAIGFRHIDVLKGAKVVAILSMANGEHPPFGVSILNAKKREVGMVSDGGLAWITGVNPDEKLTLQWNGNRQCTATLPHIIPASQLLLPCE
ncbi:fimbria/pilus outer membrane usher protein [Pantoea stewartii]|uniref:fimbria/pilus outer membrane usher protein n=1 Tax=Pantoea stewartii TaxID=66269 RepID=UPI0006379F03|nr:fimbria/pilus outer membrane usher protein [Pantoea stewartii]KKW49526.1 fimbrial assembly protein [Pantoea ananatis]MCU7368439.1 fimbria/pilus outer membrane usher protein [Pantoea stewartii]